jgi:hypothetical protein
MRPASDSRTASCHRPAFALGAAHPPVPCAIPLPDLPELPNSHTPPLPIEKSARRKRTNQEKHRPMNQQQASQLIKKRQCSRPGVRTWRKYWTCVRIADGNVVCDTDQKNQMRRQGPLQPYASNFSPHGRTPHRSFTSPSLPSLSPRCAPFAPPDLGQNQCRAAHRREELLRSRCSQR